MPKLKIRIPLTGISLTTFTALLIGIFSPAAHAESAQPDIPQAVSTVVVTDSRTGEVVFQDTETMTLSLESTSATLEVDVPLPPAEPSPFASVSGSQNPGSVNSKLTIHYSGRKDQIRTERIVGSWTPSRGIILRNRAVQAYSGGQYSKSMKKAPTSNSYDYKTGWGWQIKPPSSSYLSPRALAQTQYKLGGSGGSWLTLSHWVDLQNV